MLLTTLAGARRNQGRARETERLCRSAMDEARSAGDDLVLARAASILDWALVEQGRGAEAVHSELALEVYVREGDPEREAMVLNNLGMFRYWEGRWAEAVELYERAAEASERAGDAWSAAYGDCNVGEVLSDQGRLEEAEERLRRARRVWSGTEDDQGVAFTSLLLGRLAARAGREEDARELLEGVAETFRRLGIPGDAALADAYLAEARLLAGAGAEALALADRALEDPAAPRATLLRVRGAALALLGREGEARAALDDALEEARAGEEAFETALVLDAMLAAGCAPADAAGERDALFDGLGVVARAAKPAVAAG
jgi:tetratricopeptide (TPR) repeat protein